MKNRVLWVSCGILVVLVLLVSACGAGFAAGGFFKYRSLPFTQESVSGAQPTLTEPIYPTEQTNPDASNLAEPASEEATDTVPTTTPEEAENPTPPQSREELFLAFWQAWDMVHENFVNQPVDDVALMRGAIKGMLEALGDKHTSYLSPELFEASNNRLQGEDYEGIGAWVDIRGEFLTIISPMPDSPAEKAGLKPGDQIIAVDGQDMTGLDGEAVRQKVIGKRGTPVTLTILRKDTPEPFDVTLTREKINASLLTYKMLENDIAYVQILAFGDDTNKDLKIILEKLLAENPKGLIVDLRYNGGGYLESAIDITSQFINDGTLMYEESGDGSRKEFKARQGGVATEIPLVVLINEGSASASEILAGAIQDRGRGQLVGAQSFGKGSVQIYAPLVDEQGAVRITIARWLTPNGNTIHGVGLTPDEIVEMTDEDVTQGKDPQLDRAIEILLGK